MKRMSWAATAVALVFAVLSADARTSNASPLTAKADSKGVTTSIKVKLNGNSYNTSQGGWFGWDVKDPDATNNPDNLTMRTQTGGESSGRFVSFCLELTQGVSLNSNYNLLTMDLKDAPIPGSGMGQYAADVMATMWYQQITSKPTDSTNPLLNAKSMAAFQMAIWELVYDGISAANLNLAYGNFKFDDTGTYKKEIRDLAKTYLFTAADGYKNGAAKADLLALRKNTTTSNDNFQNQVVEIVPEPASIVAWALIGGCFVAGHRLRRSKALN